MFFRYEFEKDGKKTGILTGLDDYFSIDEILSLGAVFEEKLALPEISMENTRSYFTEKGNRTFRKAIRKIKKSAFERGINVTCEIKSSLEDILWEDEKQVIVMAR